jgi:hypothetical protein
MKKSSKKREKRKNEEGLSRNVRNLKSERNQIKKQKIGNEIYVDKAKEKI